MSTKWFKRRSSYRNQLLKIPVVDSDNGPLPYIEPVIRPKLECITGIESVPCRVRAAYYSSMLSITGRDASSFTFSITGILVPSDAVINPMRCEK